MKSQELLNARKNKNWEQIETANRLGISQSYLSLLEAGKRPISKKLNSKIVSVFGLSANSIPIKISLDKSKKIDEIDLAENIAVLGYPNFAHLKRKKHRKNPVDIIYSAIAKEILDIRILESLPWIIFQYANLDWNELFRICKINNLQNRLGFTITIARQFAEKIKDKEKIILLKEKESELTKSRLFAQDTFCQQNLTQSEKKWLKTHRSMDAKFWRLLTDINIKHLNYGKTSTS